MTDKDALELLNMFTTAAQLAKSRNKYEFHLKIEKAALIELLKKAFPSSHNDINYANMANKILNES